MNWKHFIKLKESGRDTNKLRQADTRTGGGTKGAREKKMNKYVEMGKKL